MEQSIKLSAGGKWLAAHFDAATDFSHFTTTISISNLIPAAPAVRYENPANGTYIGRLVLEAGGVMVCSAWSGHSEWKQ